MGQLTELKARKLCVEDRPVSDGTVVGLRLEPGSSRGRGKWILRYVSPTTGKRRDMGLGTYPEIGIADARRVALDARRSILSGRDPIAERSTNMAATRARESAKTFETAALEVYEEQRAGWKNAKHSDQWIGTLRAYAFSKIGSCKLDDLTPADFAAVLRPIWLSKPETASRVKQRCHRVMDACVARGLLSANPVTVVDHLLPKQHGRRERTRHQPAMPWRLAPAFLQGVRGAPYSVTRRLLELVILTAARSGEARAMTWDEIDLKECVWTVAASRMKTRVRHRVPLSERAVEILKEQRVRHPDIDLVFPSTRGLVISDMTMTKFLRDHNAVSSEPGRHATVHGFRSSFRDWASESGYSRDVADRALAHTVKNAAEAAYHRTDLLDKRREMMDAWAAWIVSGNTTSTASTAA